MVRVRVGVRVYREIWLGLGLELGFRVGVRVYREIWPLLFTPCQLMHYFCTVALWVMLNRFRKGFPPVFNYKLG